MVYPNDDCARDSLQATPARPAPFAGSFASQAALAIERFIWLEQARGLNQPVTESCNCTAHPISHDLRTSKSINGALSSLR
jgi:hypothetical protein